MTDHIGLRYLFGQSNLNAKQARWLAMISEFYFEMIYIKGKENKVTYALNRWVQVNHLAAMRSYETDLQDKILRVGEQDVRYMVTVYKIQQSTGTSIGDGTIIGIGTCIGTSDGTGTGTCDNTCIGTCT